MTICKRYDILYPDQAMVITCVVVCVCVCVCIYIYIYIYIYSVIQIHIQTYINIVCNSKNFCVL